LSAPTIHVQAAARSDPGRKRSENQDHFFAGDLSDPGACADWVTQDPEPTGWSGAFVIGPKGALLLVADGMGGAAAGALASRMAVAAVVEDLGRGWCVESGSGSERFDVLLRRAVEEANLRIHAHAEQNAAHRGMGTTVTAVGALEGALHIAQVGDSRAYLVRRHHAVQLTRDQSLVQHLVSAGAMTEEQAERSEHGSLLLQALGTEPRVEVALSRHALQRGDVVVVCSDGLFRVVSNDEIAQVANAYLDPERAAATLVTLANERGGPDNVTVVVARFEGEGLPEVAVA
jgi:protein phosphatase